MSHTIDELRGHLFAALEGLRNQDAPMEIERAKAIADVAQVVINSAKVEVDHMKVSGGSGSRFLQVEAPQAPNVRVHRLKG